MAKKPRIKDLRNKAEAVAVPAALLVASFAMAHFESASIIGRTGAIYFAIFFVSLYKYYRTYRRGRSKKYLFNSELGYYWGMLLSPSFSLLVTFLFMSAYDPFWRIHAGYALVVLTSGMIACDAIMRKRVRHVVEYNRYTVVYGFLFLCIWYYLNWIFSVSQSFICDKRCLHQSHLLGYQDSINIITFISYGLLSALIILWAFMIAAWKSGDDRPRASISEG
ncbi:hypothetical protein PWG15_09915 [Ensifer adhaerens]|uniref:hypothetical protein n=1 Tax=Ensifer adhaerens TaxID=106592 RepID=UPI0023A92548|nr:hypothetical protein [Ensifer adhaerens]WDZ78776.1 hypothetical protein PWG15_09915 [Ensifer adhaerens]